MQHLLQKLNRLHSSRQDPVPALLVQSLLLMSQQLRGHALLFSQITNSLAEQKGQLLTLLGGKMSISDFPGLLSKNTPSSSTKDISCIKARLDQLDSRLKCQERLEQLFCSNRSDRSTFKFRSLQDIIVNNQEDIRDKLNQVIIGKVDRIQLQRLYKLNQRFDSELSQIAKGLIEVAKNPFPYQGQDQRGSRQGLQQRIGRLEQDCSNHNTASQQCIGQQQLKQQLKQMASKIQHIEQRRVPDSSQTLKNLQQKMDQITLLNREAVNDNECQPLSLHLLKQQIANILHELDRLRNDKHPFNVYKEQLATIIGNHFQDIREQIEERYTNSESTLIKQEIVRINRRLDNQAKTLRSLHLKQISPIRRQLETKLSLKQAQQLMGKLVTVQESKLIVSDHVKKWQEHNLAGIKEFIDDQIVINEALCSENVIGRWMWEGQQLKNGNLIPWSKQAINTSPETYIWEQNSHQILILVAGIYQIQLGVYSKKKPSIQILVNGSTLMSAVNSNSYVIHHSSGRLKDTGLDQGISGLTLVDFLSIPSKSRIAISFTGQIGKGFISFKRL